MKIELNPLKWKKPSVAPAVPYDHDGEREKFLGSISGMAPQPHIVEAPKPAANQVPVQQSSTPVKAGEKSKSMSILSSIKADFAGVEADAEKFAVAFEKLFSKSPAALQSIENFTAEVAPVVTAAVALADPAVEPVVAAALATVEMGLAAIQASATAAVSGQSLLTNLQSFSTTVPTLLTGLDIKNSALQSTIERIVSLVTGEAKVLIPAVETWVKQIAAAPAAVKAA